MDDEDLRDLFAGLALMGLISRPRSTGSIQEFAEDAYRAADAMIEVKYAEPQKEPEEGITAIKPKRK